MSDEIRVLRRSVLIPQWAAIDPIEWQIYTGITQEQKATLDKWLEQFEEPISLAIGSFNEFSSIPEFGEPGATFNCDVINRQPLPDIN